MMYQIVSEPDVTDPGGVVPGFLSKLWKLADDEDTDELICWSEDGTAFHVLQPNLMAKELLPYYFKHSNLSSFIRQLNMYGFKKMTTIDGGGLKGDKDEMIFQHPFFVRGHQHLLHLIKRKVSLKKEAGGALVDPNSHTTTNYSEMLQDVNQMKFKQTQMNAKLMAMRRENEDLWQEVAELRKKHNNQQTIVQRLIQFLLTMARGQRGFNTHGKRKQQLAISSFQGDGVKMPKYSREVSRSEDVADTGLDTLEDYASDLGQTATTRITDVTNDILSPPPHDYARPPQREKSAVGEGTSYTVESPASADMMLFPPTPELGDCMEPPDTSESLNSGGAAPTPSGLDTPVATPRPLWHQPKQQQQQHASTSLPQTSSSSSSSPSSSPTGENNLLKNDTRIKGEEQVIRRNMTADVLDLQDELDALRDLLAKGQFTLDASTLNGVGSSWLNSLFTSETNQLAQSENQLRKNISDTNKPETGNISGNELVRYTEPYPDLLTFVETADDLDTALPTDHLTGEDDVIEALLAGEKGPNERTNQT